MSKFFRRIGRYFREGFWGVVRHFAMAISSASAVTITLTLISIFLMFSFNLDQFTREIEGTVQVSATLNYDCDSEDETRIRSAILNIAGVDKVTYKTSDEEFDYFVEMYDADGKAGLREIYADQHPMHAAYYINVTSDADLKYIAEEVAKIDGIYETSYGGEGAVLLMDALDSVRYGGLILVGALSALAIFLISNTIKLTIYARNKEIGIMRAVGASNADIRFPFVIEGILIGILGSLIPVGLTIFGYIYLYQLLGGVLLTQMWPLIPAHPFVLYLAAILVIAGVTVGLVGSFFSVSKYLRWKR